jgi:photosystem II stability/assembly factor-like uncharacterized protein
MAVVVDVSPRRASTQITIDKFHQSVSGKALCVALAADGQRAYLGGHSGVWRSNDGGVSWSHPERPQPPPGGAVTGAILAPAVYGLAISPRDPDIVLATTGRDSRVPAKNGIYRSTDGGKTWALVRQFQRAGGAFATVGGVTFDRVSPAFVLAGSQDAVAVSIDAGATWTTRVPPSPGPYWYVAIARSPSGLPVLYVAGARLFRSNDLGTTWITDSFDLNLASPADGLGTCVQTFCVHPDEADVVFVSRNAGELLRATFPATGPAAWTQLSAPPIGAPGTTASGTDYVLAHRPPGGPLHLVYSDRRTVHVCQGEPTAAGSWTRIDGGDVHVDPHGVAVTPDFRWQGTGTPGGRIVMVNDGGAAASSNGASSWEFASGLSTLGLVNVAVQPRRDQPPAITIQMGDNNGFFSADGGATWRTQDYRGGDNDCSFADPVQPNRLIVFAPRDGKRSVFLYTASPGQVPDASSGTSARRRIVGPPPAADGKSPWNTVSNFYNDGYRPLVLTLNGEAPRPDGDFVTIVRDGATARLMRTTAMSTISSHDDWITSATAEGPGVKVFRQGPELPSASIGVVQPSGGHANPVFYVGDPSGTGGVWAWRQGDAAWRALVPAPPPGPQFARRFFVDPYRPDRLYVLDRNSVFRSPNGGVDWIVETSLRLALTDDGAFPVDITSEAGSAQTLLRDMAFDAVEAGRVFAAGPAGVFATLDGAVWRALWLSSAGGARPNNLFYDRESDPCIRMLYFATSNRGLLRIGPLPPDWEVLPGGVAATQGRVRFLRVHDVGTGFGPPGDALDAEVIAQLDTEPGRSFGARLRPGADAGAHEGMLDLLRDSFSSGRPVRIEFVRTSCTMAVIVRVVRT